MTAHDVEHRLRSILDTLPKRVVACSGGVDSLLLAHRAHAHAPNATLIAHAVTPAVPPRATARVITAAATHGWELRLVTSGEFDDERYLTNPADRCYFCKTNLYRVLDDLDVVTSGATVLSGANLDDLGEYRPGLTAAAEHDVRHPWVEARVGKDELRDLAASLGLPWSDLPASPCLASRLYTGTRVTPRRLRAVDVGEELVRATTGIAVVRCRLQGETVRVEVRDDARDLITQDLLMTVREAMVRIEPTITTVTLDDEPYAPGRSFLTGLPVA